MVKETVKVEVRVCPIMPMVLLKVSLVALTSLLTLPAPCILERCIKMKINLNFYFHTSLWCLKRFYEGFF